MAIHLLKLGDYITLFWWLLTFRGYKTGAFMCLEKDMGMQDIFAFRRAKTMTKKECEELIAKFYPKK